MRCKIPPSSDHPSGEIPEGDISPKGSPQGEGTPNRKPGGQPGNKNAYKHGFYSYRFTHFERKRLDRDMQGKLADEENTLHIMVDRILAQMKSENLDFDRYLAATRAVSLAFGRIVSIHRTRKAIYDYQTTIEKAMEELKYIPFEED